LSIAAVKCRSALTTTSTAMPDNDSCQLLRRRTSNSLHLHPNAGSIGNMLDLEPGGGGSSFPQPVSRPLTSQHIAHHQLTAQQPPQLLHQHLNQLHSLYRTTVSDPSVMHDTSGQTAMMAAIQAQTLRPSCVSPNATAQHAISPMLFQTDRANVTSRLTALSLPDSLCPGNGLNTVASLPTVATSNHMPVAGVSLDLNHQPSLIHRPDSYGSASLHALSPFPPSNTSGAIPSAFSDARSPYPREYGPMLTVSSIPRQSAGTSTMHLSLSPIPTLSPLPAQTLLISATPEAPSFAQQSVAPDMLFEQIRQLSQRLQSLEAENAVLSNQLVEQRLNVHSRLSELQQQLHRPKASIGTAAPGASIDSSQGNDLGRTTGGSARVSITRRKPGKEAPEVDGKPVGHAHTKDVTIEEPCRPEVTESRNLERTMSPVTAQLFEDQDLDDQELISILSEDSERNKESTI
jgi:hypothetical protein